MDGVVIDKQTLILILGGMVSTILIPWACWITISVFYLRQEIAILKQIFAMLKENVSKPKP